MGKAARWLKGLLGMKKDKENVDNSDLSDRKDKKRWSFAKSSNHVGQIPSNNPATGNAWLRAYVSGTKKLDQNKHAIVVAAATAAAADAAVAAAHAAVAVVRLTSQGRGTLFADDREKWVAVKIQAVFRGYLSRKALRALKGLVKLQALVRGYLVRKRATATLHSMQALIRAQSAVRSDRARRSFNEDNHFPQDILHRKSTEKFETKSEYHSKRLSASYETTFDAYDENPKIIEIDTFKPKSRSRRMHISPSDLGEDPYYQTTNSHFPCPIPYRATIPDRQHLQDYEWSFIGDEYKFATAQSTPRFANSGRYDAAATPAKSVCGDSFFRPYSNYPSYMANTQSFRAKSRSHSAPRLRPDSGPKKRLSLNEIMASRTSFSGVKMQRQYS